MKTELRFEGLGDEKILQKVNSVEVTRSPVVTSLENLKSGEIRYAVYKIMEKALEPEVEFTGPRTATYTDFAKDIRRTNRAESRYGVMNYELIDNESPTKQLVLILWSPETESKERVLAYASVYNRETAVKFGINYYIVARKDADLNAENVFSQLERSPAIVRPKSGEEPADDRQ